MKKNIIIKILCLFCFLNFFCFCIAAEVNIENSGSRATQRKKINLNKLKYLDFLKLYRLSMKAGEYNKALLYARFSFVNATNVKQRGNSLLYISEVYVVMDNYKKAKMIYRQIIQNYYNQKKIVKQAKARLLKL